MFVIARNSTFTYKGKPVKSPAGGRGDGGALRSGGKRSQNRGEKVRITAQLVDALNGLHIFSERYDREFKDILAVQDEITMNILGGPSAPSTPSRGL